MIKPTTTRDLDSKWGTLHLAGERSTEIPGLPSVPLAVDFGLGPPRMAVDGEGRRCFLIPVDMAFRVTDSSGTRGLSTSSRVWAAGGANTNFLVLTCEDHRLDAVFTRVVEAITSRMEDGASPGAATKNVLEEFRELLKKAVSQLSRDELVGLVGELLFLRDLTGINPGALRTWTGPKGGRHDFVSGSTSVEVKTTLRQKGGRVRISAIDQLDDRPDLDLFLLFQVLEEVPDGSQTAASLIRQVREAGVEASLLDELLEALGIHDPDEDGLSVPAFRLLTRRFYRVYDQFPRLTELSFADQKLPVGVVACEYTLDLEMAGAYLLKDQDVDALKKSIAEKGA